MARTACRRILAGDRPLSAACADALLELLVRDVGDAPSRGDRVVAVVPGARAGRLLLATLVRTARERGIALDPPRIVTPGELIAAVLGAPAARAIATPAERAIAWQQAFRDAEANEISALVAREWPRADATWRRLARDAMRHEDELAAAGVDFGGVARETESRGGDPARARALAACAERARRTLAEADLLSPHDDANLRIEHREPTADAIVLCGMLELDARARRAIEVASERFGPDRLVAVVGARDEEGARFDALGAALSGWADATIAIDDRAIRVGESPGDQVECALRALAEIAEAGTVPVDNVVVGVADAELEPFLRVGFAEAGLAIHLARGTPLAETAPARFLVALREWWQTESVHALAALLRQPCVDRTMRRTFPGRDPIADLDRFLAERMPARCDAIVEGSDARRVVDALRATVDPRSPAELLMTDALEWRDADGAACAALSELAVEISEGRLLPADRVGAIELLLERATLGTLPDEPDPTAIESVGWLELPFDPASHAVVVGMNEGRVPAGGGGDGLLPESVREALGLPTRRTRAARDAAILDRLRARATSLTLVCGRSDARGDPLLPSRLLLATRGEALARRVRDLTDPGTAVRRERRWRPTNIARSDFRVPRPPVAASEIKSLSVTAFRHFLTSPMHGWLAAIERLEEIDDDPREASRAALGNLAHDVLARFAADREMRASTEPLAIAEFLRDELHAAVAREFGARPAPIVRLQTAQLLPRLEALAQWQALSTREGWRVLGAELSLPESVVLAPPDVEPLRVTGRIDRIDVHPGRGVLRILDFKTSDRAKSPREVHQVTTRRSGTRWCDVQLPLYRFAVEQCRWDAIDAARRDIGEIELGYVQLPADPAGVGYAKADFAPEEWAQGVAAAVEVVRTIRAGEWSCGDPSWREDPFAHILQRSVFAPEEDDAPDDAASLAESGGVAP